MYEAYLIPSIQLLPSEESISNCVHFKKDACILMNVCISFLVYTKGIIL